MDETECDFQDGDAAAKRMLQNYETPNVINRDNECLHPWGPIGHVDEVNGPGALEVPEFVPTRHELIQVVKHWAETELEIRFCWFLYQMTGSREIRLRPFASRRIDRIAQCLGEEVVEQAYQEIEDAFGRNVDATTWHVFRHGTAEEVAAFHRMMSGELDDADA